MKLEWDKVGERRYETGVQQGVLYLRDNTGAYNEGHAWNGLVTVTESPSGAESNKQYADNQVYLNLVSAEVFDATVEAFTYPDAFEECDGSKFVGGVSLGQQGRRTFGLCYKTLIGNDLDGTDHGYKLHFVYGALAAPSEKAHGTVNDSPEALTFSWSISTTPTAVGTVGGVFYKALATLSVDSTRAAADELAALEDIVYGTDGADPRLPLPAEVLALVGNSGAVTTVETVAPTYNAATDTITIPTVAGVQYEIGGEPVSGGVTITEDTVVTAVPTPGHRFTNKSDTDWTIKYS